LGEESIVISTEQDSPAPVRPGEVLAGKYRVERVLGIGGMGVVVAAHHIQLDEPVALKFLLPQALRSPEAVARFIREARAAVKIKSEHVARVSDVGQLESGAPYMVMEFLQGGDLSRWLEQNGPLPFDQAVDFVLQACVALADAHVLGIVHRDLKPANLFCVRRSDGQLTIKVLDFGISKTIHLGSAGPGVDITKTSMNMGTPLYMSPEQMRSSRGVDGRSDLWALGVILFELLTGKPPFHADSVTELVLKVAIDPTPSLRALRPDAPAGLEAVIGKCLQKDRDERYRNVAELAVALLPFAPRRAKTLVERIGGILQAAGLSESALAVPVSPPEPATLLSPGTQLTLGRTTVGASLVGSKTLRLVGAAVVAAAAAIAATVFLGRHLGAAHDVEQPAASQVSSTSAISAPPVDTAAPSPEVAVSLAPPPTAPPPSPSFSPPAKAAPATPRPASAKTKSPALNCNPPYVIDANGDRQYKPECLRR
jgi:eukaryotic-like serine/threonine-protein kinase